MLTCPICKKENQDLLTHLRISHDITDDEHCQELLNKAGQTEVRKREFRNFVRQLHDQRQEGSISVKQYEESVAKWLKEHEED